MVDLLDRLQYLQHPRVLHRPHPLLDPHVQPSQGELLSYWFRAGHVM